ncbi:MAG: hypothetical protein RLP44_30990 [Aggregatilineales bacterium]
MDIQEILTMLCGVGALCSIGLILLGMAAFRFLGRGSMIVTVIPMAFSMLRNLFPGGGNNDELDYEAPAKRISNYEHQSANDIREKRKPTMDFDAQVAQRLNEKSNSGAGFSAQSVSPGYTPQGHPLPSANKGKNKENEDGTQNAPDSITPSGLGKSKLGARPNFDKRPQFDPFGGGTVDDNAAHQAGESPASDQKIDLGPVNLPPDRRIGGEGRPSRDHRRGRNDAGQDELFGGLLDGDGDGFADL